MTSARTNHDPSQGRLGVQRLREATLWRYGYLVSQGGLSLLLYITLGHTLPAAAFPACATALGVVVIAQASADFGLSSAAVAVLPNPASLKREVARADLEAGVALSFLIGAAASVLLCLVAAAVVKSSATLPVIAVGPTAAIAVAVAGTDGLLRAEGEFRRPVIIVTASRLGAFCGVPAAASGSATSACIAISAGTVVCSLPALRLLLARLRAGNPRQSVAAFAVAAAPLGISQVAVVAATRLNTVILGGIATLRSAAIFEGAWRLYQVGQYAVGAAPSAAGPFIANAMRERRRAELWRALTRAGAFVVVAGSLYAVVLVLVRGPIDHVLFGKLAPGIGRSLLWLAPAIPLNLLVLLMTYTLASASKLDRARIALAYFVGAAANIAVLLATAHSNPEIAGAAGAAAGVLATLLVLSLRFRVLMRSLNDNSAPLEPALSRWPSR
jgi:O-antigen/teichoic acid export membrane protein